MENLWFKFHLRVLDPDGLVVVETTNIDYLGVFVKNRTNTLVSAEAVKPLASLLFVIIFLFAERKRFRRTSLLAVFAVYITVSDTLTSISSLKCNSRRRCQTLTQIHEKFLNRFNGHTVHARNMNSNHVNLNSNSLRTFTSTTQFM